MEPTPDAPVPIRRFTEDELCAGDERLQDLTCADRKLINIFADTIHQNDGSHLRGGVSVAMETSWQRRYQEIVAGPLLLYELPRGRITHRYLDLFKVE